MAETSRATGSRAGLRRVLGPCAGPLLACLAAIIVALTAELVLRLLERGSEPAPLDDIVLIKRMPPYASGHDGRGFRNPVALTSACVVAIGDSQTWGVNASREQTWPSQFERFTGLQTYNMSLGGYGFQQYAELVVEGLALGPKLVVVGAYTGNDLWETYRCVYGSERWARLRLPAQQTPSGDEFPLERQARNYWSSKTAFLNGHFRWPPTLWPAWLRAHTALGRLIDRAGATRWPSAWTVASRDWATASPEQAEAWTGPGPNTIFTPRYRLLGLDQSEPRIREGLRLVDAFVRIIAAHTRTAGVRAVLLLIPTKESAYSVAFGPATSRLRPPFADLVRSDREVREHLAALARSEGLLAVDSAKAIAMAIADGRQLYPESEDGHLTPVGYRVIAEQLAAALQHEGVSTCP